jgi:hypothetical protein
MDHLIPVNLLLTHRTSRFQVCFESDSVLRDRWEGLSFLGFELNEHPLLDLSSMT